MKRNMIIATAALAVAGVATYLIRRNRSASNSTDLMNNEPARKNHITNAFSRAKQRAMSVE